MHHMPDTERKGIASSVLSRIESEGVTPTPHSVFVVQESAVWAAGALSILIGALGVASIIFTARNSEWEYYEATNDTLLTFVVEIAPYAWLIALAVFAGIAYEAIRHTKRGYRYPVPVLTLAVIGASLLGGVLVFAAGGGHAADQLAAYVPPYRSLEERKLVVWDKPERGLIAGVVTEVADTGESFTVRSPSNSLHTVYIDALDPDMRREVVVGSIMRVMAPLIERPDVAFEAADGMATMARYDMEENADGDTSMMMTMAVPEAADVAMNAAMEATGSADAPEAAIMMMKSAAVAPEARKPVLLREACALLPMQAPDDARYERRREMVKECLRELKEVRAQQSSE